MEGKPNSAAINRVYEDIEPSEEWAKEKADDKLVLHLQGFRKEHLRIQVTSARNIRVFGERPLGHDNKWQRFRKEFPIPSNCDTNEISAKFENGTLYVKLPKVVDLAVVEPNDKPQKPPTTTEAPKPLKEAPKPPTTEAPKPQKPAPTTEAPKPQKHISTSDLPQPQKRTNANQRTADKESEPITHPSKANESTNTHAEAEASNAAAYKTLDQKEKIATKINEKLEDIRAKKVEEDSTKEDYKRAISGHENKAGGVDTCYGAQGYNYKQVIQGLVMELKQQPRKLINLGLAFVFILVLGLYVKHAITSVQEIKREEL